MVSLQSYLDEKKNNDWIETLLTFIKIKIIVYDLL